MTSNLFGIVLALLGGVLVGNCMLPLKRIRLWPWECTWLVFSLVSLLIVPFLVALPCTVPGFYVYKILSAYSEGTIKDFLLLLVVALMFNFLVYGPVTFA